MHLRLEVPALYIDQQSMRDMYRNAGADQKKKWPIVLLVSAFSSRNLANLLS